MAGKFPQPSHEPPFQVEGTLTRARSERERGSELGEALATNYQSPEAPYKNNREKRKICKKYVSSTKACYPYNSTDGSVNIDLIRIDGPCAKCLDDVIWLS